MKRKIVCLMAAIMCFSMTACEKTPDKSLVTQKNIDRLEKAAKETPKDGSTLKDIIETTTATYDFNYESDDGKVKIVADNVPVTLPTKDTIPMYRVKSGELSQEIADKLYDYFFPDGAYTTTGSDWTKQIIDNLILEEKKYIANVKDDPDTSESDKESIIQTHEGIIKEYEEERKTAPDESTLKYVPKDSSYVDVEQETVSGTAKIKELNVSSKDQKEKLNICSSSDEDSFGSVANYENVKDYHYDGILTTQAASCTDDEKKKIGISEEDAKKYVDDFVQKIGMDWEIYDVGCAAGCKYKEDLDYTDKYNQDAETITADSYTAYVFNLVQNINGIQSATTSSDYVPDKDDTTLTWLYEKIRIIVDKNGIVAFDWNYPQMVEEEVSDNVGIISFNQAKDIFEQMMPLTTRGDLEEHEDGDVDIKATATVYEVRLGLMRVRSSGSDRNGLLTPAWLFYGDYNIDFGGENYSEQQPWILLAVNAVDGSVIDVTAGY